MMTVDQIVSTQKAQVAAMFNLGQKALESTGKLVELNLQAAKASLAESAAHAQSLLSVKDLQSFVALQTAAAQPLAEKAMSYGRHVYDIVSGTGAEFSQAAEAQVADAQKQFVAAVDSAVKNAPQGSETAVAVMKNAISTASAAMESVQKAVKQASELAEANLQAVATSAVNAAPKARA